MDSIIIECCGRKKIKSQNKWLKNILKIHNSVEMKPAKGSKSGGMTGDHSSLDHKNGMQLLREENYSDT